MKKFVLSKQLWLVSLIVWLLSCIGFVVCLYLFKDAAIYSDVQTAAIVSSMGIGSLAFFFLCLAIFAHSYRKIGAWIVVIILTLILIGSGGVMYGLFRLNSNVFNTNSTPIVATLPTFTGQEVFDRVNRYRTDNGLNEVKLDDRLCNNLAQRYFDIKQGIEENVAHAKFDEWVKKNVPSNFSVGEDFASGQTVEDLIKAWEGSPGHRLSLLNKDYIYGCAYASEGYGIMILGYPVANQAQAQVAQYNTVSSRTGNIVPYHDWCNDKQISVYENELVYRRSSDGNYYQMTEGDWTCYENHLKNRR